MNEKSLPLDPNQLLLFSKEEGLTYHKCKLCCKCNLAIYRRNSLSHANWSFFLYNLTFHLKFITRTIKVKEKPVRK